MRIIRTDTEEGNSYAIMAIVANMLRQIWGPDAHEKIEVYRKEATSGGPENLKEVSKRYVPSLIDFAHSSEVEITYTKKGQGRATESDLLNE